MENLSILGLTQPNTLLKLLRNDKEDVQGLYDRFVYGVGTNNPNLKLSDQFEPIDPEVVFFLVQLETKRIFLLFLGHR